MHRFLKATIATAIVAVLPATAWATKQRFDLETFDNAPAGIIQPGQSVKLAHFRVETALGTTATIQPVKQQDDLASGLSLGAIDHTSTSSINLLFDKPRQNVTFTVVLPPSAPTLKSVASIHSANGTQLQALAIQHSLTGHRARISMSGPAGNTFDRLSLQLQRGAYIDEVEMVSPTSADATLIDFDELKSGPLDEITDQPHYIISAASGGVEIAPSSDAETFGQVLTSSAASGNDVTLIYRTRRNTLEFTVVPDPSGKPATIAFLSAGALAEVHTIKIDPATGPRRLSYTAPNGGNLQGVQWTGGKLRIDEMTLRSK